MTEEEYHNYLIEKWKPILEYDGAGDDSKLKTAIILESEEQTPITFH